MTSRAFASIFLILLGAAAERGNAFLPRAGGASSQCCRSPGSLANVDEKRGMPMFHLRGGGGVSPSSFSVISVFSTARRKILTGIAGATLSVPLIAEAYSRVGATGFRTKFPNEPFEDPPSGSWDEVEDVTLVFHGAGGEDRYTDELMTNIGKGSGGGKSYESIIDWSESSGNVLQASFNGQRVGRETASRLMGKCGNKALRTVHVIGVSVGAFAADACASQIKEQLGDSKDRVYVQLTLLDPFEQRGVIGPGYGTRNFGRSADYAQQFLNTDDPVPSTNSPLSHCACVDVTSLRPPEIFGHDWPLVYYARSGRLGIVPPGDRLKAGTVLIAEK